MDQTPPSIFENTPDRYLSDLSLSSFFRQNRFASIIDHTIVVLLVLLVIGVPLPFGSVQSLPVFVIECVAALCFLLWLLKLRFCSDSRQLSEFRRAYQAYKEDRKRRPFLVRNPGIAKFLRIVTIRKYPKKYDAPHLLEIPDHINCAYRSFFGYPIRKTGLEMILLLFLSMNIIQIIPFPFFFVSLISPAASALYKNVRLNSYSNFATLSIDPFATVSRICEYTSYAALFFVAVNTLYKRKFVWSILLALISSVTFQSIYGLYESFTRQGHIFGYKKPFWLQIASGTFFNANHYASYLAILIVLILSIALKLKNEVVLKSRTILRGVVLFLNSQISVCFFIIILAFVAVVYSRSRTGLLLTGFSLCGFLFVYFRRMAIRPRRSTSLAVISAIVILMIAVVLGPLRQRFERLSNDLVQSNGRVQVWIDTGRIIRDFPVSGTGTGTFGEMFPMYQSVVQSVYTHAHNDLLQVIAETGIFSILLFIAVCYVVIYRMSLLMGRRVEGFATVQIGAFFSLVVAFLSSLIHFSFQIPAICVTTALLTAIFFVSYERKKRRSEQP